MNDQRHYQPANGYQSGNEQWPSGRFTEPAPLSAMAVTSLVLGIVSLLTSFIPIINNFSFFIALLGIVFGIIAVVATVRATRRGKPLAIAGLVINVVAAVIVLATQSMYGAIVDEINAGGSAASSPTAQEGQAPVEAAQQQDQQNGAASFAVTIDDCVVGSDYEGKPVAIVTYTFTNSSDKAVPFFTAISAKGFQNGVQLDTGIVMDIDSQASIKEIKPGASTTVQQAYLLDDQTDVTIECTELISFDDAILATKTFSVA